MSPRSIGPIVLVLALGLLACGHASSEPAPVSQAPAPKADEPPVVGPPDVAWKDMDHEQRGRYMVKVVVPAMKPLFQGFDARRFAEFDCATCHGKGVDDHSFTMPNPDILALPRPGDQAAFAPIYQKMPDMVTFMGSKVMPEMARLLGAEPYDYTNPKPDAFGCVGCHPQQP